jgi:hypothetical protein
MKRKKFKKLITENIDTIADLYYKGISIRDAIVYVSDFKITDHNKEVQDEIYKAHYFISKDKFEEALVIYNQLRDKVNGIEFINKKGSTCKIGSQSDIERIASIVSWLE